MTISKVAVIGTGVIGASWASYFLAQGLEVAAFYPAPGSEQDLRGALGAQWPVLDAIGLAASVSRDRLVVADSLGASVGDAQIVEESGPETAPLKRELFAAMDAAAGPTTILAMSSSTITPSEFQDACSRHPERVVLAHLFNPPHLIPLVEVAGGRSTDADVIERTLSFFRRIGKHPIHLRKEIKGHVANRLQAVLWQETVHLVASGVASVEDVDAVIAHGPGLRWALLGPFLNLHLSGGSGGIEALCDKPLWAAVEALWRDHGTAHVDEDVGKRIGDGVRSELGETDASLLTNERDRVLMALLKLKAETGALS